jgi:hypothetical protein
MSFAVSHRPALGTAAASAFRGVARPLGNGPPASMGAPRAIFGPALFVVIGSDAGARSATRGFYERASALYHHARSMPAKHLFCAPLPNRRWRIGWPRTNRGG